MLKKVIDMKDAIELINDGDEIIFNGFGSMGFPEEICIALEKKFKKTGHPKELKYIGGSGQGVWNETDMIEHISWEGMVSQMITSHFVPNRKILQQVVDNKIEGYNLPLGVISHLMRATASRKPGILTKVGLGTFMDPRYGGGKMNEKSKKELVKVIDIDGEEYLFYKSFTANCAILKGTSADINGNITLEKECVYTDIYESAMAAKANGGKVIVQVERLLGKAAKRTDIMLPNILVDAIVVCPNQAQSFVEHYNPAMSGEWIVAMDEVQKELDRISQLNSAISSNSKERGIAHTIIAKRASMELKDGYVINLGIGIPEMVPEKANYMNPVKDLVYTIEAGAIGGRSVSGLCFGAAINAEVMQEVGKQFDLYDGGRLDATFVGTLQVDQYGNTNVGKSGNTIVGVGGYINLVNAAKKVVFCFPFTRGGAKFSIHNGKLSIDNEGKVHKFVIDVDQISFNGRIGAKTNQKIIYITERCVFELKKEGLTLVEIAPGIDLEKDILKQMDFKPILADNLKLMNSRIFEEAY